VDFEAADGTQRPEGGEGIEATAGAGDADDETTRRG